jgi:ADP-heptose:LPS heptosyltransferase
LLDESLTVTAFRLYNSFEDMRYQPNSILAIDASPFGRSIALLSVVRSLRGALPHAYIAVATSTGTVELLKAMGIVDDAIDLGVIKSSDGGAGSAVKRFAQIFQRARRRDYDLVLDFAPRLETQMLSRLVVRARTITPSRMPHVIEMLLGGGRQSSNKATDYENVLRQIGVDGSNVQLAISLPDEEHAQFERLLERNGSRGGEPIIVLYAAGNGWPVESFGEIGQRLANNFGARVIAVDEPSDKTFTSAVSALLPRTAIKLASPRTLELAAAIARASLIVTDEPGLARMSADIGTPVIEIAEAHGEARFSKSHRVVRGSSRGRVPTDEVYEIACEVIQESRSASLFHS